uniref:Protein kinase domain-containing protein n=1 Tax=Aureoumbra lagunensis TaxID=44058 RepID=A0A7S3JUR6_9STRA|mmetsp:Transcript_1712/g.2262  ORF Transcript_1712/g.2262 Transcript_1712/m.2262 type:complete len:581 (-) Transcript_1712:342-2084(-)|eukprot:CAMPEP_0197308346 /NCGR_PEP_ID=MMETSP0891-20130614/6721_1 /TAXON_ID=44058 ORGANISM="Aureoumbra lagunensis, Strain CCMP1510" /NCGR_SAMPLE_ID=MMETSP0891 /ASSEMBLY_ACC=CAM_ASM_000534 /LENGTH=580 /DNA_ID=CAMNT_0042792689 /DNA_START=40 /DNA_END=1782 /DNA_ORIENTATION=-
MASYLPQQNNAGIHEDIVSTPTKRERRKSHQQDEDLSTRYRRGEIIGRGANGTVYQGLDTFTGKLVAIKEVPARRNDLSFSKLMSEVQLMAKLQHRHIVGYHGAELDENAGVLIIYQEWVPGGSVDTLLARFGNEQRGFPEEIVARYALHVAKGLAYLHENRICHRDIKGGNILINDLGIAKLSDFGTSIIIADTTQSSGFTALCGTPYFMAPEIMRGHTYGRKADIWSYGGLLLQMGTGEPPWKSLNFNSIPHLMLHVVKIAKPPPISHELSEPLKAFILRCFHYDAKKRPSANQLLNDPFLLEIAQEEMQSDHTGPENKTDKAVHTKSIENFKPTRSVSPVRPLSDGGGRTNPFGRSAAKSRSRSATSQSLNLAKTDLHLPDNNNNNDQSSRWASASADRPLSWKKHDKNQSPRRPRPLGLPPRDPTVAYGQNAKSPLSARSSTSSLPTPSEAAAFDSFVTSLADDPICDDDTVEEGDEEEEEEENDNSSDSDDEAHATIPLPSRHFSKDIITPGTQASENNKEEEPEDTVITIEEALEKGYIDCSEYHRRLNRSSIDPDLTSYRVIPTDGRNSLSSW